MREIWSVDSKEHR